MTEAANSSEGDGSRQRTDPASALAGVPYRCQECGACCAYSRTWPRFTLESEEELARIPPELVEAGQGRMRCIGGRCAALTGSVGVATSCRIYELRPAVCRDCEPGDEACLIARRNFGL